MMGISLLHVVGYLFIAWGFIALSHWFFGPEEVIKAWSRFPLHLLLTAIWSDIIAIGFLIAGFGLVQRKPLARR